MKYEAQSHLPILFILVTCLPFCQARDGQCSSVDIASHDIIFGRLDDTLNSPRPVCSSRHATLNFQNVLQANGIADPISEIKFKSPAGSEKVNWCSETEYAEVLFDNHTGRKSLHLFIKNQLETNGPWSFQRETSFLMDYLPVTREYCRGLGQEDLMDIYPKCYYADDKMIIQENLVLGRGFQLPSYIEELQDFKRGKLALINLAKHHAISYAMIEELGVADSFFDRFPILQSEASSREFKLIKLFSKYDIGIDVSIKMLESCAMEGNGTVSRTMEKLALIKGNQTGGFWGSLRIPDKSDFLVLSHGDYWTNNMMFLKDPEGNKVTSQIVVDFQDVRYESLWVDLGYFMFTSVKPEVRLGRWRELIMIYMDALRETTNKLGYPIFISLEDFEVNFINHFYFGFWKSLRFSMIAVEKVLEDLGLQKTIFNSHLKNDTEHAVVSNGFLHLLGKWLDNHRHSEKRMEDVEKIIGYVEIYEQLTVD